MPEKKPRAKYNKGRYSRGVLVVWQFRAHTTCSIHGGLVTISLSHNLAFSSAISLHKTNLNGYIFKNYYVPINYFEYLGMNKLS